MALNQKTAITGLAIITILIAATFALSSKDTSNVRNGFEDNHNGADIPINNQQPKSEGVDNQGSPQRTNNKTPDSSGEFLEVNLKMPFNPNDVNNAMGAVNPIGVVRFSKDQPEFGHSGLDIPLRKGSPIYAAADGEVVIVKSAGDPWGGLGVFQLIQPTIDGEGWTFIYEHITPGANIKEGTKLKAGDLIGTKTAPEGFTAHFQLSYAFNSYKYTRAMECWVDYLGSSSKQTINTWWKEYSASPTLINAWDTNDEEGKFPFKALLDTSKFPEGPRLCYPQGTDVR